MSLTPPSASEAVYAHPHPSHLSRPRSRAAAAKSPSSSGTCQSVNHCEVSLGMHSISRIIIFLFPSETCLSRHMLSKFSITARNPKEVKPICYFILRMVQEVLMSSARAAAELGMLHNSSSITFTG